MYCLLDVIDVHFVLAAFVSLIACGLSVAPPLYLPVAPYLLFLLLGQAVLLCLLRRQHDRRVDGGADQIVVRLGGLPFLAMIAICLDSLRRAKSLIS